MPLSQWQGCQGTQDANRKVVYVEGGGEGREILWEVDGKGRLALGSLSGIPRGEITSGKGCIFEGLWYTWLRGLQKGCFNIHFTGCSLDLRLWDEEGQGLCVAVEVVVMSVQFIGPSRRAGCGGAEMNRHIPALRQMLRLVGETTHSLAMGRTWVL